MESREELQAAHGQVWDAAELTADFDVIDVAKPYVIVRRKSDGQLGGLTFQAEPRFYWGWDPDGGRNEG